MRVLIRPALALLLACGPLGAWSPRVHEAQTAKAIRLLPRGMAALLRAHPQALLEGARGVANDQPSTVEQVEAQFRTILRLSEERRRPEDLVRDLGVLAHQVQLLSDPSAMEGLSPLRESFEGYADEHLPHLLVTQEPYRAIFLTADGWKMAEDGKRKHAIVEKFLLALGVSQETARIDSEGIEHHVSIETLRAMAKFLSRG